MLKNVLQYLKRFNNKNWVEPLCFSYMTASANHKNKKVVVILVGYFNEIILIIPADNVKVLGLHVKHFLCSE